MWVSRKRIKVLEMRVNHLYEKDKRETLEELERKKGRGRPKGSKNKK